MHPLILIIIAYALAIPQNSEYRCEAIVQATCDNTNYFVDYIEECIYGIYCNEGYVFDTSRMQFCMPTESCYSYCDFDNNEMYVKTCDMLMSSGLDPDYTPGCNCKPGFKRAKNGTCIQKIFIDISPIGFSTLRKIL